MRRVKNTGEMIDGDERCGACVESKARVSRLSCRGLISDWDSEWICLVVVRRKNSSV